MTAVFINESTIRWFRFIFFLVELFHGWETLFVTAYRMILDMLVQHSEAIVFQCLEFVGYKLGTVGNGNINRLTHLNYFELQISPINIPFIRILL